MKCNYFLFRDFLLILRVDTENLLLTNKNRFMKKFLLSLAVVLGFSAVSTAETLTVPTNAGDWSEYTWTPANDDKGNAVQFAAKINNFEFQLNKGTSSNAVVAPDKSSIRVYAGANLTIVAPSGYVMTKVEGLTASNSKATATSVQGDWTNETGTISAAANQSFAFTASTPQSAITFDGAGKQLRVKTITITYSASGTPGKDAANLKFEKATYTATLGQPFAAPEVSKDTDAPVTYASSDEKVATVDAATGAVTLVAGGTTTITATTPETDDFSAGKASYTLEVVDPNVPGLSIENPMTVAQALAACDSKPTGVYVKGIVKAVTTVYSSQYKNVTFTIVDAATDTEVLECFRAKWGAGVTPSADNNPVVGSTVIMLGDLTVYNGKKELNSGCQIVKYEEPALPSAGLSFPEKSYTINFGDAFTAPALTKATDAAATYTSSVPAVAEVDPATGAVTVKAYGTTVITANTPATASYRPGEASYTLEVLNPEITVDKPLTVAQALAVSENAPHKVFVKGVVTEVTTAYDENYKNVSFNIADAADGTEVLLVYRAKWAADVNAPEDFNPVKGATVIISGNLKVYNGTKEFDANCQIVKYDATTSGVEEIMDNDAAVPAVYYNLQGVRVANPENGLYIRVQGNKATKVLVK